MSWLVPLEIGIPTRFRQRGIAAQLIVQRGRGGAPAAIGAKLSLGLIPASVKGRKADNWHAPQVGEGPGSDLCAAGSALLDSRAAAASMPS